MRPKKKRKKRKKKKKKKKKKISKVKLISKPLTAWWKKKLNDLAEGGSIKERMTRERPRRKGAKVRMCAVIERLEEGSGLLADLVALRGIDQWRVPRQVALHDGVGRCRGIETMSQLPEVGVAGEGDHIHCNLCYGETAARLLEFGVRRPKHRSVAVFCHRKAECMWLCSVGCVSQSGGRSATKYAGGERLGLAGCTFDAGKGDTSGCKQKQVRSGGVGSRGFRQGSCGGVESAGRAEWWTLWSLSNMPFVSEGGDWPRILCSCRSKSKLGS